MWFIAEIELICDSGSNSTNVGKLIEALYKNNRNYFMTTIKELNEEKQKKILLFLDNNNSNTNNNCNDKKNQPRRAGFSLLIINVFISKGRGSRD